ncbi:hypothetical protein [Nocardia seriolae]|nr:hypothetical protein [Nocardia seriolae]QOW35792.1 hypothetical protein IMZ23_13275 [Nocardia seriolae]QUN16717.1 hypothetical protein KEC46_31680 [Nocardia seriolae]WKY55335.1 hypothetical protein Q5P07_15760 [Nocardia seriolae]WNJ56193.1 hypothetical protein RMO66_22035 [Nocardia seriolae]
MDNRWDESESAVACVADVSVDGGAVVPMMGLLAGNGELVIPTDWDDPPVADGVGHVIRIELRPPWIRLGPGRVQSVLEGCHTWRLGYGSAGIEAREGDPKPAHVIVTALVPGSVRASTSDAEPAHNNGVTRQQVVLSCAGALLVGFVVGWLILRIRRSEAR